MKKFLVLSSLAAMALAASAVEPLALVFENTDGTKQAYEASGLTITVSGSNLQLSNSAGSAVIELGPLARMYFTGESSIDSIPRVNLDKTEVVAYASNGRRVGAFSSTSEAMSSLPAGIYVMKSGKNSFKLKVK